MERNPVVVDLLLVFVRLGVVSEDVLVFAPHAKSQRDWVIFIDDYTERYEVDPHFSDIKVEMAVCDSNYDRVEEDREELRELINLGLHQLSHTYFQYQKVNESFFSVGFFENL